MKNVVLIMLGNILALGLLAQKPSESNLELSGVVISDFNGQPLPGAMIEVNSSKNDVFSTDSKGHFSITDLKKADIRIEIYQFGYLPFDTTLLLVDSDLTDLVVRLKAKCEFNKESAQRDIRKGKPRLLLVGGIIPVIYGSEADFEKKFKVKYYDFGCVPEARECITEYNMEIFEYLNSKYSNSWRNLVRPDVIGLE